MLLCGLFESLMMLPFIYATTLEDLACKVTEFYDAHGFCGLSFCISVQMLAIATFMQIGQVFLCFCMTNCSSLKKIMSILS